MSTKLKVINLFGGPGAGKSTTRASLFSIMKVNGINVEEVTEYAKDKTWEENRVALSDQLYLLGNQNYKLSRLQDKVEWVVSDSPILLGIHYSLPDYLPSTFKSLVYELWDRYDNYNFFIDRGNKPYSPIGRNQTSNEAKNIDNSIRCMLQGDTGHPINYRIVNWDGINTANQIYKKIFVDVS